ncbi:methyltransferase [Nocardia colli]|uniref:Methyltransferase n=1 Tax=Nocardia colli TaxID=2545717 RepID=A0A5N0EB15_9NOCA|nr:methyltransferase [Nocardia colli]KAA8885669.1 methyltransferase [Nocardia colli]
MVHHDEQLPPTAVMGQMLDGFLLSQALFVLAEAGVATILDQEGPQTVAVLAERTGSDAGALARLIRTVTPHGVFRTEGDKVAVTPLGATLSEKHPQSMYGIAVGGMHLHYRAVAELAYTLRTGEPAAQKYFGKPYFDYVATNPELAELFGRAMTVFANTLRAGLFDGYRLPAGDSIADLGGGDGAVLVDLLGRDGHLDRRGVVFDLPGVVDAARATLSAAGMAERVEVVAGNFFEGVPGADIYLLSWILHDWNDDDAAKILKTVAASAAAGARLLVAELVVPAGDAPHPSKDMDLVMLSLLGGKERTADEYRILLNDAGFDLDRVVPTPSPLVILEATKR